MSAVFADTGFFVALVSPADQLHAIATEALDRVEGELLTTDYVLIEVANFLRKPNKRSLFLDIEHDLRLDEASTVIPASTSLLQRGIDLYRDRPDKDWSLTDCTSFVAMKDRGVTEALTGDRHFEQAGFAALLVSS